MKPFQKTHYRPFLYGFHAVHEAWLNPSRAVKTLYLTDHSAKGFEATLLEARHKGLRRPEPVLVDKKKLEKMLPQGAVHQGLALDADDLDKIFLQDVIIQGKAKNNSVLIMLDQVTDPHNVGAILRSASAFGADAMILQTKHAPDLNGVLAKTACGAVEHLPVVHETNLSRAIQTLQDEGYRVYGLDETGDDLSSPTDTHICLVLGAEGPGLRRLVKEHCDSLLRLPTQGAIQSLNVSNAAAVALYAFTR